MLQKKIALIKEEEKINQNNSHQLKLKIIRKMVGTERLELSRLSGTGF